MKTARLFFFCFFIIAGFSTCNTKPHYVDISGKVIDAETGAPVEGVKVIADSYYSYQDNGNQQNVYTDGNGEFSFPHFKMSYPGISLKNQKSSTLSIYTPSIDYIQRDVVTNAVGKHASKYFAYLYVSCRAKGNITLSINSSYVYDYGIITGQSCKLDNSYCIGISGTGSSSGIYSFTPSTVANFQAYIMA